MDAHGFLLCQRSVTFDRIVDSIDPPGLVRASSFRHEVSLNLGSQARSLGSRTGSAT